MSTAYMGGLFRWTSLIRASTSRLSFVAHYKLENLQPSGSFKDRGISHMVKTMVEKRKGEIKRLVSSSGGNAGHAVAIIGEMLNLPVDVFVPVSTMQLMTYNIKKRGANVHIGGVNWDDADEKCKEYIAENAGCLYVPPYDDPLIWDGHSTLIDELVEDYKEQGIDFPDCIILSVGGGGLLRGVQLGLERHRLAKHTQVIAVETEGTASFAAAKKAGKIVNIDAISGIATSLGALSVVAETLKSSVVTKSVLVTDQHCLQALNTFNKSTGYLVEPACGAALALVENESLAQKHVSSLEVKRACVIVCGGNAISQELYEKYVKMYSK